MSSRLALFVGANLFALLSSCGAPPKAPPRAIKIPDTPSASAVAAPVEEARVTPTPLGRAGWFEVFDDDRDVAALRLSDDKCLGLSGSHRWLITRNKTVANQAPTPCDGDATDLPPLPPFSAVFSAGMFGHRIAYLVVHDVYVGESAEAAPERVETSFGEVADLATSGSTLLAIADKTRALYRLDDHSWTQVVLDGGRVEQVRGLENGEAYAITSKNQLFESTDAGKTWKPSKLKFATLRGFATTSADRYASLLVYGTAVLDAKNGGHGTGRPEEAQAVIANDAGPRFYEKVRIRTSPPAGVVDMFGVDLRAKRDAIESLTSRRKCTATDVRGTVAAAACEDDKGRYVLYSDDLGASVREIHREGVHEHPWVNEIVIGDGELLLSHACEGRGCGDARLSLLRQATDGWSFTPLELPTPEPARLIAFDRRNGFFFVAEVPVKTGASDVTVETVFHTHGTNIAELALTSPFGIEREDVRKVGIEAASVGDDGVLRAVIFVGRRHPSDASRAVTTGYAEISDRLRLSNERVFDDEFSGFGGLAFGIGGSNIIANLGPSIIASSDGGKTFKRYPIDLSTGLYGDDHRFTCGPAGCDFNPANHFADARKILRWGDKPLSETLDPPRAR